MIVTDLYERFVYTSFTSQNILYITDDGLNDESCHDLFMQTDVMCHYLTVRCLLEAKEYNDALQVINESEIYTNITQAGITFSSRMDIFQDASKNVNIFVPMIEICEFVIILIYNFLLDSYGCV